MHRLLCLLALILGPAVCPYPSPAQIFFPLYEKGTCSLEMDFKIGGDTDNDDQFLYQPRSIAVDPEDNIYILDLKEFCIKKFDPDGGYLKTFGRRGEGPGELALATRMALDPDGNVVIYDLGNRRFTVFDPDGEYLDSHQFMEQVWGFDIGPHGDYYVETQTPDFTNQKPTSIKIKQFSPDFACRGVVDSADIDINKYITEPMRSNVPVPFHPDLHWAVTPAGNIVVARSSDYTFKLISPELKVIREYQHRGKRLEVTEEDKKTYFESGVFRYGDQIQKGKPDFIRRATSFPKYKPYFKFILLDDEGNILVQTYEQEDGKPIFDVFSGDFRFIGRIALPDIRSASRLVRGRLYTIESSEEELPAVVRYRLK